MAFAGPQGVTGEAHDGDTFKLSDGQNARLYGADAFELKQQGRQGSRIVPIGEESRSALLPLLPGATATGTGGVTYGRPVATLDSNGQDVGQTMIRDGWALAAPDYLKSDPSHLTSYMEAERLARLNRMGAHAGQFQAPSDFRQGKPDPWAKPEAGEYGNSIAVFNDEPMPFQGLRPEIAAGYQGIWTDLKSTPDDLLAFAKANGIIIGEDATRKAYAERAKRGADPTLRYADPPKLLTNPGDGAVGAGVRGLADPINMLDEIGGVVDTLGGTGGRESIWNSERRFGDILYNNIDQNRSILGYDDANHPYARFGGQLASGLVLPGASIDGVGLAAARTVLREGGSRFAAGMAAKAAVRSRLATAGAVEGGLAGFGQGEGGGTKRLPMAGVGAITGGALGYGTGALAQVTGPFAKGALDRLRRRAVAKATSRQTPGIRADEVVGDDSQLGTRAVDRLDIGPSRPGTLTDIAGTFDRINTARPFQTPPPVRDISDIQPDIEAWAQANGALPHSGDMLPAVMLHGSPYGNIDSFDPYGRSGYGLFGSGTYLTDNPQIAAQYSKKGLAKATRSGDANRSVYAVQQSVNNPIDMDKPADIQKWTKAAGEYADFTTGMTNEEAYRAVEDHLMDMGDIPLWEGAEMMSDLIRDLGHDGITHLGGGRVGNGPRHRVVIALDPEQTTIKGRLSVDDLMTPPRPRQPDWIDVGEVPPPPAGFTLDAANDIPAPPPGFTINMENEAGPLTASISGPRVADRIDVNNRARPMDAMPTEAQRFAQGQRIEPGDVVPLPSNEVASLDEAAAIGKGMYAPVRAGDETDALARRNLPSPVDATRTLPKRGPVDLVTFMRSKGGLVDQGGELRAMGIRDNAGRDLDFARGEQRFGRLLNNDNGMRLDEAADLAWREGYFPDHAERPTVAEFLDALDNTNRGTSRAFRSDDLGEIDAFNAARDRRLAVERARDEGAPLVDDRSQPATLADLEANQPPVAAYEEWGQGGGPDFAGNIRLGNLDSPQNIKRALAVTDQRVGGFDAARRGRITQAETERLAGELGMTPDDLLKRRKGQAFNAEEALAARQILAKSGNELVNMARAIQRLDDPGEEKLAAFRQAWVRHVAIQEQVAGATAEAGRALSQFRQMADSRFVRGNVLDALSQAGGGKERLKAAADMILENSDNPGAMNSTARKALKSSLGDKFKEYYINALLSGPQTHVVNAVSNTMTALAQIPEHAAAAAIGGIRNIAARGKADDRILFSELGARSVGLLQGTKEGLAQAARTFRTGEGADFGSKVEAQNQAAIPGKLGSVIRVPTRLLSSSDELFKAMARRMELNGLAVRKAHAEGLSGEEGIQRAADLVANPTDEMMDQAFDYGRYVTFQRPLGKVGTAVTMVSNSSPVLKVIVPFVRTPTNLLKFAVERSPAAPLLSEWRRDMRAGGAKRDLALARAMVGSGVGALIASLAAEGKITGNGPADEGAKQLLRADGWQPYSIKVGDKYISYQRLDPLATTLGVASGMVDLQEHMTEKQQGDVATLVTASLMQNLANKTWLSGISNMVEAINEPERYAGSMLERTLSAIAVPTGVAQVARTIDPTMREAESILDAVKARVPGLSQSLPPRRDVWGKPVVGEGGLGPDILSPIWESTRRNDPVNNALLDAGLHINKPSRDVGGRRLNAEEWGRYRELIGSTGYDSLNSVIQTPSWAIMDKEDKKDTVEKLMKDARSGAKLRMFGSSKGRAVPPPPPGFSVPPPPPGFAVQQ